VALAALYDLGVGDPYDIRQADVWRGRWDFAQLYDWRGYISLVLGWPDGLVIEDIDEFRNRLAYGVRDSAAAESVQASLEAIELPCELVIVEVTGPISLLEAP
jgi:hypothetical protein